MYNSIIDVGSIKTPTFLCGQQNIEFIHMPTSLGTRIYMARCGLRWNQDKLAETAGIDKTTLVKIEKDKSSPSMRILSKIEKALNKNGAFLTDNGAEITDDYSFKLVGEDWFSDLLDDVFETLLEREDKELLIAFADDKKSPAHIVEKYRHLRANGIQMRQLVEEGNTYLQGDVSEYCYIPSMFFENYVHMIYGNKVAMRDGQNSCTIYTNKRLVTKFRNLFNLTWYSSANKPEMSTAHERF